jgi:hypothetical protein
MNILKIMTAAAALMLVAGAAGAGTTLNAETNTPSWAKPKSAPVTQPTQTADLVEQFAVENDKCRGGSGDNPETWSHCTIRDKLNEQLEQKGLCYNPHPGVWAGCPKAAQEQATTTIYGVMVCAYGSCGVLNRDTSDSLAGCEKIRALYPYPSGNAPITASCVKKTVPVWESVR